MEDYVLENSKGATYMSFILDVEIVLKKEGNINIAEERVRSKKEAHGDSKNKEQQKTLENTSTKKNNDSRVYSLLTEQTNLGEVSNKPNTKHLSQNDKEVVQFKSPKKFNNSHAQREKKVSSTKKYIYHQKFKKQKLKSFNSYETNKSGSSEERQGKRRRMSKLPQASDIFKGKTEPVDFLECNRIFLCNYFLLPKRNGVAVPTHNMNKILKSSLEHLKHLLEQNAPVANFKAISEILLISNKKRAYSTDSSLTDLIYTNSNESLNDKMLVNPYKLRAVLEKTNQTPTTLKKCDSNGKKLNSYRLKNRSKPNFDHLNGENKLNHVIGPLSYYKKAPSLGEGIKTKSLTNIKISFKSKDSYKYTTSSYEVGNTVCQKFMKYNENLINSNSEIRKITDEKLTYDIVNGSSERSIFNIKITELMGLKKNSIRFSRNYFIPKIKKIKRRCTVLSSRYFNMIRSKLLKKVRICDLKTNLETEWIPEI